MAAWAAIQDDGGDAGCHAPADRRSRPLMTQVQGIAYRAERFRALL